MPLYDFSCKECNRSVEVLQSFYADPPACCGKPMERGFGSLSLVFWKSGVQAAEPIMHNTNALSQAAYKGWAMEQGLI